jgi:serine/threonine-protein kinase RsbW
MGYQRIFGRIDREEFVGRGDDELAQIVRQASRPTGGHGVLVLAPPPAGVSELLRQAFDQLFLHRGEAIPIYFALARNDGTPIAAARRFFHTFLQQYIAYRRVDASLCDAPLTLNDLLDLALPTDYEWISKMLESFAQVGAESDERSAIRFCLTAPQKATAVGRTIFPMIDEVQLADHLEGNLALGPELADVLSRSEGPFALAGLRRQLLDLVRRTDEQPFAREVIRLKELSDDQARLLLEHVARRDGVELNEATRDLIVQQLNANPLFIASLTQAAREASTPLTSFMNCQRLYVEELMGGRINRYFSTLIDEIVPDLQVRKNLLRLLSESLGSEARKSSLWTWAKLLGVEIKELQQIVRRLHVYELVNASGEVVEVNGDSYVWHDYLRARYRTEVAGESRALVVAEMLVQTLERAPRAMARKYRREAALGLQELLSRFGCQRVPATLLHYDRFAAVYKGLEPDQVNAGLDAESDLLRLPQAVHVAAGGAFSPSLGECAERCAIAHGFDGEDFAESNEVIWLAAEIDSKLEASRELTEEWCNRLATVARECGFKRIRLWLVAPEGFSPEASHLLNERDAYGSSRRQVELLTARIKQEFDGRERQSSPADEYEMVIPMGADTELIAAQTVEQIARRLKFRPEAINQIKTALIEACINATEHSLSPDRKIYQRFRVENDRLVLTVASRGVVPASVASSNGEWTGDESTTQRRGWGLKLIRTLMDEVEFERVDDGTQLRMTKYLR